MAAITPNVQNGKILSYRFRACVGRDALGKQAFRSTTWIIPNDLTPSKAEKAAHKTADLWEKTVRTEYEQDLANPQQPKNREIGKLKPDFTTFVLEDWFPICLVQNGMAAFVFDNPAVGELSPRTDPAADMSDMYTRQVLCNNLLNSGPHGCCAPRKCPWKSWSIR